MCVCVGGRAGTLPTSRCWFALADSYRCWGQGTSNIPVHLHTQRGWHLLEAAQIKALEEGSFTFCLLASFILVGKLISSAAASCWHCPAFVGFRHGMKTRGSLGILQPSSTRSGQLGNRPCRLSCQGPGLSRMKTAIVGLPRPYCINDLINALLIYIPSCLFCSSGEP